MLPSWLFWCLVVVLCGQRLLHFGAAVDEPHMWRQCDTAQYAWAFYSDGIDLFHPAVCWLGDHRTTILEMPLPEAVVAVAYHLVGPHHQVARAVFFAAFLVAAALLHALVRELLPGLEHGGDVARVSVVLFLAMPLGLFYSRALVVDFFVLALAEGMALCLIRGARRASRRWLWAGCVLAALALPVKAPVVLALAVPTAVAVVVAALSSRPLRRQLPVLVLPLVVFALWQRHVEVVNRAAPDWSFIPDYHQMVDMWGWYFGSWQQRLRLDAWLTVVGRWWHTVVGPVVALPALLGVGLAATRGGRLLLAWLGGALLTLVVFFNLNVHHDYYQIPWLGPVAAVAAVGVVWLGRAGQRRGVPAQVVVGLVLVGAVVSGVRQAEASYYSVRWDLVTAGEIIARETPPSSLLVASAGSSDCRNPTLLYSARRYGWSLPERSLTPALLARLRDLGATHLAVVSAGPLADDTAGVVHHRHWRSFPLGHGGAVLHLGELTAP